MLDTLSNVKSRLGITTTDYDTFLTAQITLIGDVIEAYCRRKFSAGAWAQTFYKNDRRYTSSIELYHFPAITLTSLTIDDVTQTLGDFRLHKASGTLMRVDGGWIYGEKLVAVYTAGYAAIPTPILSVLDSLVEQRYNKKKSGVDLNFGSDVQRISIPGAISIDFDYSLSNNDRKSAYGTILGSFSNVLDDWRSERTVLSSGNIEYVEVSV